MLGVPLVYYSLSAIDIYKKRFPEDNIYVALNTDSEDLIDIVSNQRSLDVFVIRREESLAGDTAPKVAVIRDCLVRSEAEFGTKFDTVVDLDITSPIRTVANVRDAIMKKVSRNDTDVVYSVTDSRRNPYFNMVKEENGYFVKAVASSYTARQQAPVFYDMNASIYAYSVKALMEKESKTFFNDKCDAVMMKDTGVLDIDSEEDFELISVIADHFIKQNEEYREIYENAKMML